MLGGENTFGELEWLGLDWTVAPSAPRLANATCVVRDRTTRCCYYRRILPGNARVTYSAIDSGGRSGEHDSGHLTLSQKMILPRRQAALLELSRRDVDIWYAPASVPFLPF